jgi:hypothetical protein
MAPREKFIGYSSLKLIASWPSRDLGQDDGFPQRAFGVPPPIRNSQFRAQRKTCIRSGVNEKPANHSFCPKPLSGNIGFSL